jgi:hypothetical protein
MSSTELVSFSLNDRGIDCVFAAKGMLGESPRTEPAVLQRFT